MIPVAGLQRNNFAVRWSGTLAPPAPGDYKLGVRMNYCYACQNAEGFRLYLDGKLLVLESAATERRSLIEARFTSTTPSPIPSGLNISTAAGAPASTSRWQAPAAALRDQAVEAAKQSDVIGGLCRAVAFARRRGDAGEAGRLQRRRSDRIDLPAVQEDLLKALAATGKPLIVVLQNGSALAVNWAQEHANAILEAWYPGEEGGTAIAETLAGDNNPAGRLPLTFYASLDQVPAFEDYSMKARTYRYFSGKPLYGFGYGLSYTTFAYSNVKVPSQLKAGEPLTVTGDVKNTGSMAGDEVVELYLSQPKQFETPIRALASFQRIHLEPGQTTHVSLTVDPRSLGQVDAKGNRDIVLEITSSR